MNTTHRTATTAAALALALAGLALPSAAAPPSNNGGPHILTGTLTAINTTAGTLTLTSASGTMSVVTLTSKTTLTQHKTIAASAIAVGDTLDVTGVPLTVSVSSLVDRGVVTTSGTGGASGSTSGSGKPSPSDGGAAPVPGQLRFTGVVTENDAAALVVSVGGTFSVTLTPASGVKLSAVTSITASQLAVGDAVSADVSASKTGTLTALRVDDTPAS